jgi:hypothetical protein
LYEPGQHPELCWSDVELNSPDPQIWSKQAVLHRFQPYLGGVRALEPQVAPQITPLVLTERVNHPEMSEQIRTDLAIEARGLVKRYNEEVLEEFQQPT